MDAGENPSPKEELHRLYAEGKVSQSQYTELLEALETLPGRPSSPPAHREPEFRAFRKRILIASCVISAIGIPAGLLLKLPYVAILGIIGLIVAPLKLHRMRRST